jgi:hypothetical protein
MWLRTTVSGVRIPPCPKTFSITNHTKLSRIQTKKCKNFKVLSNVRFTSIVTVTICQLYIINLKKNNFHKEKNLYVIPEIDEARSAI